MRKKWNDELRNLKPGDVVAVLDSENPRGTWKLGRVLEVELSKDKIVRSALVRVANRQTASSENKVSDLRRPVHRLCLLLPAESESVPIIGPRAGCVPNPEKGASGLRSKQATSPHPQRKRVNRLI